jgi:hypothetical protein
MDFGSMLTYLQGLLSNKQGQQNQEYQSNLGLQNQVLGQQGSEFNAQLGQQGSEFNANLALQTLAQNQANDLANKQFGLAQQGQNFGEAQTTKETSLPFMQLQAMLNPAYLTSAQNDPVIKDLVGGISPLAPVTARLAASSNFIPASQSPYGRLIG